MSHFYIYTFASEEKLSLLYLSSLWVKWKCQNMFYDLNGSNVQLFVHCYIVYMAV